MVTCKSVCIWNIADYLYVYRTLLWLCVHIRNIDMVTCMYMNITMVICMYMEHCCCYHYTDGTLLWLSVCIWNIAMIISMYTERCYGYLHVYGVLLWLPVCI